MNDPTTHHLVRRALTRDETRSIGDALHQAANVDELRRAALAGLYNALLADLGRSLADLDARDPLLPQRYAIPASQWDWLVAEATGLAAAWGASVPVHLDLSILKPDTYDDPQAPVPDPDPVDHRPEVCHLRLSRRAVDTIHAIHQRLEALRAHHGPASPTYRRAADSWLEQTAFLFSVELGARIAVDSDDPTDLNLEVHTSSGLVVGVVFRPERRDGPEPSGSDPGPVPGVWTAHS